MKKKQHAQDGFTLIELVVFIVITSLLASAILLSLVSSLQKTSTLHQQVVASQLAKQCMEWFIGQRRANGFTTLTCPSTPSPTMCTTLSGYTINNSITCTTLNGDSNFKTITVTVSGAGDATLTSLIASY
jgi:prepilin-type N-terminal cleavage/methylation domain-containing protein